MTRPHISNSCDSCNQEIPSDQMSYSAQFSQKQPYSGKTNGKFVTSLNRCDLCKSCFLALNENNFKVKWKTMMKDKISDKWVEVDPQEKILEA